MDGGGVIHPVIIASKNLKINKLKGSVSADGLNVGDIQIGFGYVGVIDEKYCRSIWENSGEIVFNGKTFFGPGTRIVCNGQLTFHGIATINAASDIICWKKIDIGDHFLLSWQCLIMDTDFHKIVDGYGNRINHDAEIRIGDNVWIGCRSIVLKKSLIPNDCVIGAGSVVSSKLESTNAVYRDDKVIRSGITWQS